MSESIWLFVVAQVVTAGGVYAAIRSDLREHGWRLTQLEKWREKEDEHG